MGVIVYWWDAAAKVYRSVGGPDVTPPDNDIIGYGESPYGVSPYGDADNG